MYECPNCNANLRFDIRTQNLLCDHCGTQMNPYAFQKERDAEEVQVQEEDYEVTVFTCPQCGGQLLSDDTTAATFCSFCGGSTILDSRISNQRRPAHIIPFQKTKEDCRKIYLKMMRRAPYAPTEMKREEYIARMRSIYIPYWVYTGEKNGRVKLSATKQARHGNYDVTQLYNIRTNLQAKYTGLAFDASEGFSDALSNAIAPFQWREARPFTPAYLSGFYADVDDVDPELYESDVSDIVGYELYKKIAEDPVCTKYTLGDVVEEMRPNKIKRELSMFPVWFLTYRNKDRVSYAVINGQTGKAAGDIPVDKGKYFLGSLLLAIPLFILLNLVISMQASTMLFLTGLLAGVCAFISVVQKKQLRAKEDYMDDKGSGRYLNLGKKEKTVLRKGARLDMTRAIALCLIMLWSIGMGIFSGSKQSAEMMQLFSLVVYSAVMLVGSHYVRVGGGRTEKPRIPLSIKDIATAIVKPAIGGGIAAIVLCVHPSWSLYYYVAAVAVTLLIGWDVIGIIDRHNLLTSRPLPQFNRRGGEEDGR